MAVKCELLAKSSRHATAVNLALSEFARQGGRTDSHKDGSGIACDEGPDVRLIKDNRQASESPWERFVEEQGLQHRDRSHPQRDHGRGRHLQYAPVHA